MKRLRVRTLVTVIVALGITGGLVTIVVMRLTRPGEPSFIRAAEPPGAHRLLSLHTGGRYLSRPTTFIMFYGTDQQFGDVVAQYGDTLKSGGFALRQPLGRDATSARFKKDASNECVSIDSTVSRTTLEKLAPGSAKYQVEYSVTYQRRCAD